MSEMVGRVARAIEDEGPVGCCTISPEKAMSLARAAIEAMREPTEAMIEAVEGISVGGPYLGPLDADDIYGQMIDAALSEVEG